MPSKRNRWVSDPRAIPIPPLPVIVALKAVAAGTANEQQQKRFMQWLVNVVCGYGEDMAFFGETEKTFYALGRRRVATVLRSYIETPIERFKDGQPSEQVD